jgi:hypothetical protein
MSATTHASEQPTATHATATAALTAEPVPCRLLQRQLSRGLLDALAHRRRP